MTREERHQRKASYARAVREYNHAGVDVAVRAAYRRGAS